MAYDVNWHDENHTIIRMDIYGEPSWDGFHAAVDNVNKEFSTVSHRVDLIFNASIPMPPGNPMPHLKTAISKINGNANLGLIFSVTPQQLFPIIKSLIEITMRIYQIDTKHSGGFVNSLEEAMTIIEQDRARTRLSS
jgi:hypothetical protein